MAKRRVHDQTGSAEDEQIEEGKEKKEKDEKLSYGELIELDLEKRKARRDKRLAGHKGKEKEEDKGWRERVAEAGRERGFDVGKKEREEARRKQTKEAAIYSNLKKAYDQGILTRETLVINLKTFRPAEEYRAYQRLEEAIREGEVGEEILELKNGPEENTARVRTVTQTIRERKNGGWVEKRKSVEVVKGRVKEKGAEFAAVTPSEETGQTVEEWYRKLLREYALGELSEKDVRDFLSAYPPELKKAHEKLLREIAKKKSKEHKPEKLSNEEIDKMVLGVREYLRSMPSGEGKPILERLQKVQMSEFKHILEEVISEEDAEKRTKEILEKEKITPEEAREKAEKELVAEAARKVLAERELVVHGRWSFNKEKGAWGLSRYSDLDGKCAMDLLQKAGMKGDGKYVPAGDWERGAANADTGFRDGFLAEFDEETIRRLEKEMENLYKELEERKKELANLEERAKTGDEEARELFDLKKDLVDTLKIKIDKKEQERWAIGLLTLFFDHHGPYSNRDTSATKVVYGVLTELGLLKFKDEVEKKKYEKVIDWVTKSDNFSFPDMEKHFQDSDRKMIGFVKFRGFDQLLKFAESGKEVTDLLTDGELRKFGLIYKDNKTGKLVDRTAERRETIKKTLESVRELISQGWTVIAKDGKKFIVDTQGKLSGEGQWAAASLGYDGIIRYNAGTQGFSVALNKGTFDKEIFAGLPRGILIRGSMFLQPEGREKLTVTLGDLVGRLAPDFNPGPRTELKRFLEIEPRRIRAIVSQSPEGWWWTNTPDGKKVVVRGLPPDFKSGQEAYLVLRKPKDPTDEERRRYGGNFYVGSWESDEIILPKKVETKAPVKAEVKPEASKASPEKELTPVEKERQEKEKKLTEAVAAEEKIIFNEFLQKLEGIEYYRKKDVRWRENFAHEQIKRRVEAAEKELRKKYGL